VDLQKYAQYAPKTTPIMPGDFTCPAVAAARARKCAVQFDPKFHQKVITEGIERCMRFKNREDKKSGANASHAKVSHASCFVALKRSNTFLKRNVLIGSCRTRITSASSTQTTSTSAN